MTRAPATRRPARGAKPYRPEGRVLVEFLRSVGATAAEVPEDGLPHRTAVRCRRRPNRRPCPGCIEVIRLPTTLALEYQCPVCGMGGTITNWKSSDWNPSRHVVAGSVGEIPGGGELGPRTASSEQGQLPPEATRSDIAQELVCLAWETSDLQRRVELAQAAIVVSSDCSDAYVLLAEMAADPAEARALHEKALTVAGRVLGAKAFSNDVGHFWGLFETRPYMRARAGLASCLWRLGDHAGAIAHYWELLRLNPTDNQGVRYVLMGCLLRTGQDEAAAQLLVSYAEDGDASWAYSAALLAFKKSGDTPETRALRSAAYEANGLVWPFLLGRRPIPKKLPEVIGVGDEGEAVAYAADYKPAWKKTPGAIEWFCAGAQAHNARPLH